LEVTVLSLNRPTVKIESPRNPGVYIEMVDHQRDSLAPTDAIYSIGAYMPKQEANGVCLNGDVYKVYVGKNGIILDDGARQRARHLPKKGK
jgi:hypothetical protein